MMFLAPDEDTWVGALRLVLQVPASRSLKDRRRAVAHVRDRIRARGGFSVSEVGHLHDHQRAVLAVVTVSRAAADVRRELDRLAYDVERWGRVLVMSREVRMFRPFDGHVDDSEREGEGTDEDIPDAPWAGSTDD
ncbi:MAG: hypothetical protein CL927_02965 [Deltaproteobacteria bacterium]|nr:hypothetical protein [Deltaproteobacteria bacterium]HCH66294.1 hypothetical protein [Deltaproteobacteria bacterium]